MLLYFRDIRRVNDSVSVSKIDPATYSRHAHTIGHFGSLFASLRFLVHWNFLDFEISVTISALVKGIGIF